MTNLEIIKYLATNNPTRLAELLDDIYCNAWNCGSCAASTGKIMEECEVDDFNEWLNEDASKCGYYYDHELDKWHKAIHPTYTIMFNGGKLECKDGKLSMWRDDYDPILNINKAIDDIKLLENIMDSEKIPQSVYDNFRNNACAYCSDQQKCLRSKMDIAECLKDENWEDWV